MRALVGQLMPDGRAFRARPVDREGQPHWLLYQMKALFHNVEPQMRQERIDLLLYCDWVLITGFHLAHFVYEYDAPEFVAVCDVGVGHNASSEHEPRQYQLADGPDAGVDFAYLWGADGVSLHVYTAAHGRWHRVASLPPGLLAAATDLTAITIHDAQLWLTWWNR